MIDKKYYVNVRKVMEANGLFPRPRLKIISVTVPLWSDLNVRDKSGAIYKQ